MKTTQWRRQLQHEVTAMLGSLGDHPSEVALRLHDAGVRGTPGDARDCAIAVYLSAVVAADPAVRTLRVGTDHIRIVPSAWWRSNIFVALSGPLRKFVTRFDGNLYPELVRGQAGSETEEVPEPPVPV